MKLSLLLFGIIVLIVGIIFTVTIIGAAIGVPLVIVGIIIALIGLIWPIKL